MMNASSGLFRSPGGVGAGREHQRDLTRVTIGRERRQMRLCGVMSAQGRLRVLE